jgi:hypothetical protein
MELKSYPLLLIFVSLTLLVAQDARVSAYGNAEAQQVEHGNKTGFFNFN